MKAAILLLTLSAMTLAAYLSPTLLKRDEVLAQVTGANGEGREGATGLPLPRFVSLRAPKINLRSGPGFKYPIKYVFQRRNLPVEIIDEFETWRQIRDWEGIEGWVHQSMLQGLRTARVMSDGRLRSRPEANAQSRARVESGAIGTLERCEAVWCYLSFGAVEGYLERKRLYGLYPDEKIE